MKNMSRVETLHRNGFPCEYRTFVCAHGQELQECVAGAYDASVNDCAKLEMRKHRYSLTKETKVRAVQISNM